jgi:hypothetical protein
MFSIAIVDYLFALKLLHIFRVKMAQLLGENLEKKFYPRFEVDNIQVHEGDNLYTANTFHIRDDHKTVELYTQSVFVTFCLIFSFLLFTFFAK